jgi:aminopeptidase-like protein
MNNKKAMSETTLGIMLVAIALLIVIGLFAGVPKYNVWQKGLRGEAQLREAEWNRQIQIKEAEANLESEKLNAQAEIERAIGVAEANKIIGEGLKNNEEYIKYLWVKGLTDGSSEVIYVPTEANLPILEATR